MKCLVRAQRGAMGGKAVIRLAYVWTIGMRGMNTIMICVMNTVRRAVMRGRSFDEGWKEWCWWYVFDEGWGEWCWCYVFDEGWGEWRWCYVLTWRTCWGEGGGGVLIRYAEVGLWWMGTICGDLFCVIIQDTAIPSWTSTRAEWGTMA